MYVTEFHEFCLEVRFCYYKIVPIPVTYYGMYLGGEKWPGEKEDVDGLGLPAENPTQMWPKCDCFLTFLDLTTFTFIDGVVN